MRCWCPRCGRSRCGRCAARRRPAAPRAPKTADLPTRERPDTSMGAARHDASHVFYRKLNRELPLIVRGEGVYLYDASGKRYLDACGGAMVASVGHGVKEIADAIGAQAATLGYVNGTMFTS